MMLFLLFGGPTAELFAASYNTLTTKAGTIEVNLETYGYTRNTNSNWFKTEYTDEQQLKEIIDSIYPFEMLSGRWDYGAERDDNIGIFVYFKTDSPMTRSYGTNASYSFLKGQVPDFVIEDTAYREK